MRLYSPRIRLMGLAALLPGCVTLPSEPPSLKRAYASKFKVGAAVNPQVFGDAGDAALLRRHFSSITARNAMKPYAISPNSDRQYDFSEGDAHVAFAEANGIAMRGHTLVWHFKSETRNAAPDWFFTTDPATSFYRPRVLDRLHRYVTAVVSHYRGRVYAWDVVNEVASDVAGEVYRTDSPWFRATGPDYIETAFRAARAADPSAKLFINDYNTENADKLARVMRIVDDLKSKGVPVDGVGHQLHMHYNDDIVGVTRALAATAARGLINHVTELDISVYDDPGSCSPGHVNCEADFGDVTPPERLEQQARLYGELFQVFARTPSLQSVTTWGLSDRVTWLNTFPVPRLNRPLLFDTAGQPKAGFWAALRAA